jgi:hypothetical protein
MIMPTTGKRKTTRDQMTFPETGRFDLKISTVACVSKANQDKQSRLMGRRTPSNNIKNQNNEPHDTATSTGLPGLRALHGKRRCLDEEEHGKLKKRGEGVVEHPDGGEEIGLGVGCMFVVGLLLEPENSEVVGGVCLPGLRRGLELAHGPTCASTSFLVTRSFLASAALNSKLSLATTLKDCCSTNPDIL